MEGDLRLNQCINRSKASHSATLLLPLPTIHPHVIFTAYINLHLAVSLLAFHGSHHLSISFCHLGLLHRLLLGRCLTVLPSYNRKLQFLPRLSPPRTRVIPLFHNLLSLRTPFNFHSMLAVDETLHSIGLPYLLRGTVLQRTKKSVLSKKASTHGRGTRTTKNQAQSGRRV